MLALVVQHVLFCPVQMARNKDLPKSEQRSSQRSCFQALKCFRKMKQFAVHRNVRTENCIDWPCYLSVRLQRNTRFSEISSSGWPCDLWASVLSALARFLLGQTVCCSRCNSSRVVWRPKNLHCKRQCCC